MCRFDRDPDLYFNAGPARIPGHHSALLGYCKELGVPLSPFMNENRNAWVQDDAMLGGRRVRLREYLADTRGFIAELMVKSLAPERMHAPFTGEDYERVVSYLREFGGMDQRLKYEGSARAGYATHDLLSPGVLKQPLNVSELLRSDFMYWMSDADTVEHPAVMLEPVGGMDRIVTAFMDKVGGFVRTRAIVTAIHVQPGGVEIAYTEAGRRHTHPPISV